MSWMEGPEEKRRRRSAMLQRIQAMERQLQAEKDACRQVAAGAQALTKVCFPDLDAIPSARSDFHRTQRKDNQGEEEKQAFHKQSFVRIDSDEVRLAECQKLGRSIPSGYYNDGGDGSYRIKKRFY